MVSAVLGACAEDAARTADPEPADRAPARAGRPESGPTTTTTTAPTPPAPRQFTITGSRAGFASGYELVRRESPADVRADLDLMASTGARWLRVGISWAQVEPGRGAYDWAATDLAVRGAVERGLSVIAAISTAPGWDAHPGCDTPECAPLDPAPYADFMRVAAARYAPLGVRHWEIWNEPNNAAFWGPRPDPVAYTELLVRSSSAIHAVDPGATVLSGGLSPGSDTGSEISPLTFLRRIYELGGGASIDAVAHHPYHFPDRPLAPVPTNAFLQTPLLHDLMVAFGDGAKQIWGTEVGAPTRGAESVSEQDQSAWLREYYDVWNGWAFTGPLLWYTARDQGNDDDEEDSFGLVHHDRSPKPAFATFEAMVDSSALLPDAAFPDR